MGKDVLISQAVYDKVLKSLDKTWHMIREGIIAEAIIDKDEFFVDDAKDAVKELMELGTELKTARRESQSKPAAKQRPAARAVSTSRGRRR